MPSNQELIAIAAGLDPEATTDGLSNKELSALVADLKAKKKDAGALVAEGKAVTSKVGIMSAGTAVTAEHFAGGQETLNRLLERGVCVEAG